MQVDSNSLFGDYRKVISCDEIFEVVKSAHEKSTAHSGLKKTFEYVSECLKHLTSYLACYLPFAMQAKY